MPKKIVQGNTENLNLLKNKVNYIGFELEKVPAFLKKFEPYEYRVPKIYDETTYKVYKYVKIEDIDILITPKDRMDDLGQRYKLASPLSTYMKPETNNDIEKYAYFLKMINQTNIGDIQKIEKEQQEFEKEIPFDVKFADNYKWQVFYSDYANRYFMLASTNEVDNSPMFYLLKRQIAENKSRKKEKGTIFIPICNEEYSGKILKKSEIEDAINYLWYFTKDWAHVYEVVDKDGNVNLQIVGEAKIYDKMTSKYRIVLKDKKQASIQYKLLKALFILSYELPNEYNFQIKISEDGGLSFYFNNKKIEYESLAEFLKEEAISKIKQNEKIKMQTKEIKADIKDLAKKTDEETFEYMQKEKEIVTFLECKKSFMGKLKYFFKGKNKKNEEYHNTNKSRLKEILDQDKEENIHFNEEELNSKNYTVEDVIKIGKKLEESKKENVNIQLDINATKSKLESIEKKLKNATKYLEEIEKHKKSIFDFWKYANKDEEKMLAEGESLPEEKKHNLKKTFDYEEDIEDLASLIDKKQREELPHKVLDAIFASNFVLDGINEIENQEKISKLLETLKEQYKKDIDKIEKKDFDIFGNVSEDKTKIKVLKNNKHRENEKDKFRTLNVNLNTTLEEFTDTLKQIRQCLLGDDAKIEIPYQISLYKASNEKIEADGFNKFSLSPFETLENLEKMNTKKETYLYKINVPENTKLAFYSNITFFENDNNTLPLGMDVSQEGLINLNLYTLELVDKEEFNMNMFKDEFENYVKKIKVYEYNLVKK